MFIQPKPTGMSFTALMSSAQLSPKEHTSFPYTTDVVRCRYCTHCRGGRCALKSCCCLPERVKARSCTFTEILNDCFADVRNLSFRYRLRLAAERQRQVNSCFLGAGHRSRFYDAAKRFPNSSPAFLAQLYVLTAENWIWSIIPTVPLRMKPTARQRSARHSGPRWSRASSSDGTPLSRTLPITTRTATMCRCRPQKRKSK